MPVGRRASVDGSGTDAAVSRIMLCGGMLENAAKRPLFELITTDRMCEPESEEVSGGWQQEIQL